jgi:nucleoside-diphosphate-sugar epimerase
MKVLVVGGTRFIGIDTVECLLDRDHSVTIYNRGTRTGLWPGQVRELHGDRRDADALRQLEGERFDGVIDFCAYTAQDTRTLLDVVGTVQRFVHMSSGTVYQMQPHLPWDEDVPYGPAILWGAYAKGKIECEQVLRAQRSASTASTVIRAPWVLGPRSYADREKFVLNRLLDHAEILIPGDGKALQQFVSSRQLAWSIVAALEGFDDGGWRAFNIASPGYVSLEGFVQVCASVAGVEPRFRYVGRGATRTGSPVFDMTNPVFPFPNENYLLALSSSEATGIAPGPVPLESMVDAALTDLLKDSRQRNWQRTSSELSVLEKRDGVMSRSPDG